MNLGSPGARRGLRSRRAFPRAAVFAASLGSLALAGCKEQSESLLVATAWNRADRSAAVERFLAYYREHQPVSTKPPVIEWLVLEPAADPVRLLERARPPDVVLGLREPDLGRLADMGALNGPVDRPIRAGRPSEDVARDRLKVVGLWIYGSDFRRYYAALLLHMTGLDSSPFGLGGYHLEPLVVLAGARSLELARAFAQGVADPLNSIGRDPKSESDGPAASFLALMLESITVDARDELAAAGRALERAGRPAAASAWLVEPPPWPPASVAKLLDRPDQSGDVLVIRLAESLVPDPARRDALVRSWLAPPRPIDEALARELAGLAGGDLIQEPRLRDWLRAEWTAWARQRFRRVARLAPGGTAP